MSGRVVLVERQNQERVIVGAVDEHRAVTWQLLMSDSPKANNVFRSSRSSG